ncbi:rRNA maturation RNase YbeY [Halomonas sp. HP20-15]|uniref:rRNA maturation RNase YbeY n=1 Tax=Halomonas sp. HP20-15 TaxID=3085901 RepID=UPI0029819DB3|nr:rRNA maturation RNase YbeY [Halomonas sp. HP20-15]MDW5376777.1 rRNA maturation RNase YbeY [Halomonas sp. HP20-15]
MNDDPGPLIDLQLATERNAELPGVEALSRWVAATLAEHARVSGQPTIAAPAAPELTIRLVDDDESQALNRDYRGKDRPTNVLSFPFEAPPGIDLPLLGDLVISHPTMRREARQQHKPLADHYAHLVIHGTLHLLGYDHIDEAEAEIMEALERAVLDGFGIPDPYALADDERDSEDTRPDA